MSKQNYILLGLVAVVIIAIVAIAGSDLNFSDNSNPPENGSPSEPVEITLSEEAKEFTLGGSHAKGFKKLYFDPFSVESGQEQKVVATMKSDLNLSKLEATLEDGSGEQQKELEKATLNDDTVYYLSWKPSKVSSGQYYSVAVEYTTDSGKSNEISLSWEGK